MSKFCVNMFYKKKKKKTYDFQARSTPGKVGCYNVVSERINNVKMIALDRHLGLNSNLECVVNLGPTLIVRLVSIN